MSRAPYNVLVIPYRINKGVTEFAIFRTANLEMWQFIAGGGENDELPYIAAQREAFEEAGISPIFKLTKLDSIASIPRKAFPDARWDWNVYVIPEYCYSVCYDGEILLSHEHAEYVWSDYDAAMSMLTWDSNKVALYELMERIKSAQQVDAPEPLTRPGDP